MPRAAMSFWARAVCAVLVRPWLWPVVVGQLVRLARIGWWRRPPFLPVPDLGYLRFRLATQYGARAEPEPRDLVVYLEWCRDLGRGMAPPAR